MEVVAIEVAEQEFARFAEAWDIDMDTSSFNENDMQDFVKFKSRIMRRIVDGHVVVDESGELSYTLLRPVTDVKDIKFVIPHGQSFIGMDKVKAGHDVSKTFSLMADMVGQPRKFMSSIHGIDYKLVEAVFGLFMGS